MKIEKWHQELDRFLDIKTAFLIEGDIYDLHVYPTKTADGIRYAFFGKLFIQILYGKRVWKYCFLQSY